MNTLQVNDNSAHFSSSKENEPVTVKTEAVLMMPQRFDAVELDNILTQEIVEMDYVDEYDEDITFYVNRKMGFGKPYEANSMDLVKHENDVVSGSLAFSETVKKIISIFLTKIFNWFPLFLSFFQKTGRIYGIGMKQISIPKNVIQTLKMWNTKWDKRGIVYDRFLTISLLLVCADPNDILLQIVSDEIKQFIRGKKIILKIFYVIFAQMNIHIVSSRICHRIENYIYIYFSHKMSIVPAFKANEGRLFRLFH